MNKLRWAILLIIANALAAQQISSVACTCSPGGSGPQCVAGFTAGVGDLRADCLAHCTCTAFVPVSGYHVYWAVPVPFLGTGGVQGQQLSTTAIETSGSLLLYCGLTTSGGSGFDERDCLGGSSGNSFRASC